MTDDFWTYIPDLIPERTTRRITTTLLNEADVEIPLVDMTVMTLTLYVHDAASAAPTIINGRNKTNILNASIGTYHATSGLLTITFTPLDTAIVLTPEPARQIIRALVEFTYGGGKEGKFGVQMTIENLVYVPTPP